MLRQVNSDLCATPIGGGVVGWWGGGVGVHNGLGEGYGYSVGIGNEIDSLSEAIASQVWVYLNFRY